MSKDLYETLSEYMRPIAKAGNDLNAEMQTRLAPDDLMEVSKERLGWGDKEVAAYRLGIKSAAEYLAFKNRNVN